MAVLHWPAFSVAVTSAVYVSARASQNMADSVGPGDDPGNLVWRAFTQQQSDHERMRTVVRAFEQFERMLGTDAHSLQSEVAVDERIHLGGYSERDPVLHDLWTSASEANTLAWPLRPWKSELTAAEQASFASGWLKLDGNFPNDSDMPALPSGTPFCSHLAVKVGSLVRVHTCVTRHEHKPKAICSGSLQGVSMLLRKRNHFCSSSASFCDTSHVYW